ncbi:DNA repair and recombination protein RadB [Candidatus Woesearchaeota archaeon]|nr:DNA repair and recombination protein RadB [Candidatus Woesearchaeota archaeon]
MGQGSAKGPPRTPSGSAVIDRLLAGGYEQDVITTIFGPAGSGKTNLCIIAAIEQVKSGRKVIYIDTEASFSVARMIQLTPDYESIIQSIVFLKPNTFAEQKAAFGRLLEVVNEKVGLIVVDSIAMLYRLELGKDQEAYELNRELGRQLSKLTIIAREKGIPVLLTNQVYADFSRENGVTMVGGDILRYGSKCLIELQKLHSGRRKAVLRKHRSLPEDRTVVFEIREKGLEELPPPEKRERG